MSPLPRPVCAVLFDWDGTLADTVPLVTAATNRTLDRRGYPHVSTEDVHDGMRFPTVERMLYHIRHTTRTGDGALGRELADEFYEHADQLGHRYVELFAGVRQLLATISELGLPMGIVTNNMGSVVRSLLRHFSLQEFFPVVVAEENVTNPKPDPEGLVMALRTLDTDACCALFVGDSVTDAEAAVVAGVTPVGAGWPEASIVHKPGNPYQYIYSTPEGLRDAIVRSTQ